MLDNGTNANAYESPWKYMLICYMVKSEAFINLKGTQKYHGGGIGKHMPKGRQREHLFE